MKIDEQRPHQRVAGDRLGRRGGVGEADRVHLLGLVGAEAAALDQRAADRAADHRGDDEAEGRHGDAGLGRAGEAAGGELGRPGDDGAVAAEERGRAEHDAEAHRQAGDPGAEAADEVLQRGAATAVTATRMPRGWPPLRRSAMRALRPMPVKKISSRRSRAWVSKLTSAMPAS